MIPRRVRSLLSLLPLLASLPNLYPLVLLLPSSCNSLTLNGITPPTPAPTTPNETESTPRQNDGWVEVLGGEDYYYDDDWLLNQTLCSDVPQDQSPKNDDVDFHDVKNQIVEHVLGGRGILSDPEHLRLRAQAAWKHQEGQRMVLEGPLLFTTRHIIRSPGGGLLESTLESEETVQVAESTNSARNKTEVGETRESDSDSVDGGNEDSKDGQVSEYSSHGNYVNGSEAVANDNVTREMVAGEREAITEGGSADEGEEQEGEGDVQEGEEEKSLEEEKKEDITEVTVEEGTRLRLVCNVTGVKHIWVEWRRAANLTFPGGSAVVGARSVLFDFVGREDAGTYICTARNPHGATYSTSLTIHVQYAPVVGVWARTMADESVELGCLGEGQPRPTLEWYKNNTRLSTACEGNTEVRSTPLSPGFVLSVVRFSNTTTEDFALYHCRAVNSLGVSRSYLMLHDGTGAMSPDYLEQKEQVVYSTPVENPRLASFLLGMVPPLYIALYIIAYLGCYKSPSTGTHGRFGANVDTEAE